MSLGDETPRVRRSDPTLASQELRSGNRVGAGVLRGLQAVLSPTVFVFRRARVLRRSRGWNWIRAVLLVGGLALASSSAGWMRVAFLGFALLAAFLRRLPDPDWERRIQRIHGADYLLNGGEWAGGPRGEGADRLRSGTALHLLVRGSHLLLLPKGRNAPVHVALRIDEIDRIRVDGRDYGPVYVPQAKQPPSRDTEFDRHAVADLSLEPRQGEPLRFRYRGPFASHLAETAAHAVHSVRSGRPPGAGEL